MLQKSSKCRYHECVSQLKYTITVDVRLKTLFTGKFYKMSSKNFDQIDTAVVPKVKYPVYRKILDFT